MVAAGNLSEEDDDDDADVFALDGTGSVFSRRGDPDEPTELILPETNEDRRLFSPVRGDSEEAMKVCAKSYVGL